MNSKVDNPVYSAVANSRQVGGNHYQGEFAQQHWDYAWERDFDYFQGVITKYVERWKRKNGLEDLRKAQHYLEKYIELVEAAAAKDKAEADNDRALRSGGVQIVEPTEDNFSL